MRILLAGILDGIVMFLWTSRFLPLLELARVLVRFDDVARRIVNANHSVM